MLILSRNLERLTDPEDLARHLAAQSGLAVSTTPDRRARAIVATPGDTELRALAAEKGIPLIELRKSWTGLGLSLAEFGAGDVDRRPARLLGLLGGRLTDALVQAAARTVSTVNQSEEPGCGADAQVWRALARGEEVVTDAPNFATALGLARARTDSDDPPRRNLRDRTLTALATEVLFNVLPDEPQIIAAAVVEAVRALVHPRPAAVSVVITAYNYGEFVADAVSSALRQTHAAAEVIVVDDGSTDATPDLLATLPGIRVIRKDNGGQASAFNAGFAAATGDVVLFLDGDDRLAPEAVQRVSEVDYSGVSRAQFLLETIDRQGHPTGLHAACHRAAAGDVRGALRADGVFWFMPTSGNAFPRRTLETLLPMPEVGFEIAADLYLVLGAALLGRTEHLPEVLGQYRVHGGNAYYHANAGALYLREKRRAQRLRAWTALVDRVGDLASDKDRAAVEADLKRLLDELPRDAPPDPVADPLGAAGKAQWPTLQTGETRGFLWTEAGASLLGAGWSDPGARGSFPRAATAHLGFRLPAQGSDWKLALDFRLDGPPLRGVAFLLNGQLIDRRDIFASGTLDLWLPGMLLPLDGTGTRPALLSLDFAEVPGDAFGIVGLRADRVQSTGGPAPALAEAEWHGLTAGSRAEGALWSGWDWPDDRGVRPVVGRARLAMSFSRAEDRTLLLDWDGSQTPLAFCGDRPLDVVRATASGTCLVALPAASGFAPTIDLLFPEIGADSRLRAICWLPSRSDSPAIGAAEPIQDLVDARSGGFASMTLAPAGASPMGKRAQVRLPCPVLPEGGFLTLDVRRRSDPAEPLPSRIGLDGRSCTFTVGAVSQLRFRVAGGRVARDVVLDVEVLGSTDDLVLASACFDAVAPRRKADTEADGPGLDLSGALALAPLWHSTSDGAVWLGAPCADLVLPDLRCMTKALMIRTLTLDEPLDQHLAVSLIDDAGRVLDKAGSATGISELRLAVPEGMRAGMRLRIATDHLVSADLVGADAGPMLGGALLSVTAE